MLIHITKYFLIILGTWIPEWTENTLKRTINCFYRWSSQGVFLTFAALICGKLTQLIIIGADTKLIYFCIAMSVTALATSIKIFLYQKNKVSNIFEKIFCEEQKLYLCQEEEIIQFYAKNVKLSKKYISGATIGIALFLSMFFSLNLYLYLNENKTVEKSEESIWCPIWLPFKDSDYVGIVAIINLVLLWFGANMYLASQVVFFTLMKFIVIELKIQCLLVGRLDSNMESCREYNPYNSLREIIMKHSFIINFMKELNNSTKYVMLTDFLLNSVNVASVAIQVIMVKSLKELAFPLSYLIHLFVQVFILGWLANEIKVQALAVGDAVYQTKWYDQDLRTQKLLLIILHQSQQPLTMSIGPFGPMTFETALGTIQAAYSYVTLMQN